MENEEKNTEELENLNNTEDSQTAESSNIEQANLEAMNQSMFENNMLEEAIEEETIAQTEETSQEIFNETVEEISPETEQNQKPEEIPDFLKDIVKEKPNTEIQKEETINQVEITSQESYVSTVDEFEEETQETEKLITVRPVKFQQFKETPPNRTIKKNLDILQDVTLHISVELGRTKSSIKEVMEMEQGSIVELDKIAGEQVEVFVNDKLVAKGEVIVIEDKFGVRVTSTSFPKVYQ